MAKLKWSAILDGGSGAMGDMIVAEVRGGAIARRRPTYKRPTSAGQAAAAARMASAMAVWGTFSAAQAQVWRDYAEGVVRTNRVSGGKYRGSAQTEFVGLATKFLQASPAGVVPVVPPSSSFVGDRVRVSVESYATAQNPPSFDKLRMTESGLSKVGGNPLLSSPGHGESVDGGTVQAGGGIRWTADAANDGDTVTELMLQKLVNVRRKPSTRYSAAAFVQFVSGSLSYDLPLDDGVYALAYRFVRLSTGQATGVMPVGVVEVGGGLAVAA